MLLESIKTRRSTRRFKPTPVTKEQIKAMLEAAMLSPSACNTRPWRFIAITNRDMINKLADAHNWAKMLYSAQLAIIVVALPESQDNVQNGLPLGYYPQDCGAATENILIQAEACGLGTCWIGVYPKEDNIEKVSAVLDIPKNEIPFCIIAVGEKDEWPDPRGKYEEEKVTWIE